MRITSISFRLFFLVLLTVVKTRADSVACELKEKHLALLDLAKESISKAKNLQPECGNNLKDLSTNSSECGAKAKVAANLDIARNLIDAAKENYTTCDVGKNLTKVVIIQKNPADCSEILENGDSKSGRYRIWPRHRTYNGKPLEVYCDMDTDGGGWTVIQRRGNFSKKVDFYRNWNDYKNGFGNISEEFWIGNDKIFVLTNQANYTLRFDLENVGKEHRFANYSSFWVEDESAGYMLHYGYYKGTAGDSMRMSQNEQFSTKDKEYEKPVKDCPSTLQSGWWFSGCGYCNPNGLNKPGVNDFKSMYWHDWTGHESLLTIEMKIRPEK